jgi:hypothetical protein
MNDFIHSSDLKNKIFQDFLERSVNDFRLNSFSNTLRLLHSISTVIK